MESQLPGILQFNRSHSLLEVVWRDSIIIVTLADEKRYSTFKEILLYALQCVFARLHEPENNWNNFHGDYHFVLHWATAMPVLSLPHWKTSWKRENNELL